MKDSFGRDINYARISITDLCNLRCVYCMPEDGIHKKDHEDIMRVEEIISLSKVLVSLGITKIRLTGGEPLVRNGILDIVKNIGNINGLKKLVITTNGILLPKYAKDLKKYGVTGLNISLDTLKEDRFKEITRCGKLQDVMNGIKISLEAGFENIKVNAVLINGFNTDEIVDFVNLTRDYKVDVRFIELMPMGSQVDWSLGKFIESNYVLETVPSLKPIESDDPSSPATYYKLHNGLGKVGLISSISCKFCKDCNRIRITSEGKIKNCLHSDDEVDIREFISDEKLLKNKIEETIKLKPHSHNLENGEYINKNMVRIGG